MYVFESGLNVVQLRTVRVDQMIEETAKLVKALGRADAHKIALQYSISPFLAKERFVLFFSISMCEWSLGVVLTMVNRDRTEAHAERVDSRASVCVQGCAVCAVGSVKGGGGEEEGACLRGDGGLS